MINSFSRVATRSQIADWVEVAALVSPRNTYSWGDLAKDRGIDSDAEHEVDRDSISGDQLEREITESGLETLISDIGDELQFRSDALGENYPFILTTPSGRWVLTSKGIDAVRTSAAYMTYSTCLLISGFRHGTLISPDSPHDKKMEECMQRLSWILAGSIVGGRAYWFGYPRPDNTPTMRSALTKLTGELKRGKVRVDDPDWSSGHEHDGGIDIVAWRSFVDGRPGSVILYGQVASGTHWTHKPVTHEGLNAYFNNWFLENPTSHYLPATFIPFMQHDDCKPRANQDFETAAFSKAHQFEQIHGLLVDRMRLCELAGTSDDAGHRIVADGEVMTWMNRSIELAAA